MVSSHNKQQSFVHSLKKIVISLDKHLFGVMNNKRYQWMLTLVGVTYIGLGIVFLADLKTFVHAQTPDVLPSSYVTTSSDAPAHSAASLPSSAPQQKMGCGQ